MNSSFNIDWQQLRNLVGDLEIVACNAPQHDREAKIEQTKLIYLIEKDLADIKNKLDLPLLNPNIRSASVENSFHDDNFYHLVYEKSEHGFIETSKILFRDYFKQNDFQYWLLIFLLIKNNDIRSEHLTLYKIIDEFIDRVKDQSFSPGDIQLTGSGATRCKTNLRFAFNDLKDLGLLYLYDKKQKNSWTLTFIGFFAAASFCFKPADKEYNPLGRKITKFNQPTYYYQYNSFILDRISELSDPGYFQYIVRMLRLDSLGLKELERGPEIFKSYHESVTSIFENESNDKKRMNKLAEYLNRLNAQYPLEGYMEELSLKFDAEAFYKELVESANLE